MLLDGFEQTGSGGWSRDVLTLDGAPMRRNVAEDVANSSRKTWTFRKVVAAVRKMLILQLSAITDGQDWILPVSHSPFSGQCNCVNVCGYWTRNAAGRQPDSPRDEPQIGRVGKNIFGYETC